jgi:type VI secretion system secreted protein Hcp
VFSAGWNGFDVTHIHACCVIFPEEQTMASADFLLKIDGVDGESAQKGHEKAIDCLSWSWGESNAGSHSFGTGGGTGKVSMQDFHFVMSFNNASPVLMQACATGKHIGKAQLFVRKAGDDPQEYMTWTFHDLLISSYQTGGHGGGDLPTDQVSFNYTKVELEYKPQDAKGKVGASVFGKYDLKKGGKY